MFLLNSCENLEHSSKNSGSWIPDEDLYIVFMYSSRTCAHGAHMSMLVKAPIGFRWQITCA